MTCYYSTFISNYTNIIFNYSNVHFETMIMLTATVFGDLTSNISFYYKRGTTATQSTRFLSFWPRVVPHQQPSRWYISDLGNIPFLNYVKTAWILKINKQNHSHGKAKTEKRFYSSWKDLCLGVFKDNTLKCMLSMPCDHEIMNFHIQWNKQHIPVHDINDAYESLYPQKY